MTKLRTSRRSVLIGGTAAALSSRSTVTLLSPGAGPLRRFVRKGGGQSPPPTLTMHGTMSRDGGDVAIGSWRIQTRWNPRPSPGACGRLEYTDWSSALQRTTIRTSLLQ